MNKLINEALEGYKELKDNVDENPEETREKFIDILDNKMWAMIGVNFDGLINKVENLDLETEDGKEMFKEYVDQMIEKVEVN